MNLDCTYSTTTGANRILLDCPGTNSGTVGDPSIWAPLWFITNHWPAVVAGIIVGLLLVRTIHVADQWNRAVVLRLGKFHRVAGPGLFIKLPFIERIAEWVSVQIEVTNIKAEKTLTKDTVPVDVKTILFWKVTDPRAAVIEVADYEESLEKAAQVSLREAIGAHDFTELLSQRDKMDDLIRSSIERKIIGWGVEVASVEIQDVEIPEDLQDAMSREAQAEREKHARVILGQSEVEIATQLIAAAKIYEGDPVALQLRAMNIIYETTKERGSTVLLPTSLVDAFSAIKK
jgi:regulator of protease activity HflC (stomatin/prohibitin superfamily)